MAPVPNPGPTASVAATGLAAIGIWRLLAVAAPHLAALALMFHTEVDFGSLAGFLLSWGILNFFWIALLRRPALSGARLRVRLRHWEDRPQASAGRCWRW